MQQMYSCPNCGTQVAFGVKFCPNCGTPLNWPTQQGIQPPARYEQQEAGGWGQGSERGELRRERARELLSAKFWWSMALVLLIILCGGALRYGCDTFFGTEEVGQKLEILSHSEGTDELLGFVVVRGQARNTSGGNLTCAQVCAKFYDGSGSLVATRTDAINELGPGEVWNFEINLAGYEREVARYDIKVRACY